ncbi:MAG: alpha/beta-type small acid-soluble spore protein [Maledivibacter sp.]|jgi:hypothetical protein|nr:alpha/beta-type small acid-soluble spore protein [Maledivibacter sp.]
MSHKKTDRNARKALNEFKYEMSKELGANDFSNNNVNTKKFNKNAKKSMRNRNEF